MLTLGRDENEKLWNHFSLERKINQSYLSTIDMGSELQSGEVF